VLADVGVIGGSGLYALLDNAQEHVVETPYGTPSDRVTVAEVGGRAVAFLPRHGRDHRFPPHRIPYRANLWALRELGVRQILAPCAVGGLRPELGPGTFVLPDQLIDRTSGRVQTYHDHDNGAVHVNFADPYCPTLRAAVRDSARRGGVDLVENGTMVVVEGPRFSTRAESRWFAAMGCSVVNMTGHPEAVLARELGLCYATIALVTDLDAGVDGEQGVTQEEVFRVFGENTARMRTLLLDVCERLPAQSDCLCLTSGGDLHVP
jgi:5'-methylthioadenosine phosphorylase